MDQVALDRVVDTMLAAIDNPLGHRAYLLKQAIEQLVEETVRETINQLEAMNGGRS